jgi:long-subunit fatty acid transport protein
VFGRLTYRLPDVLTAGATWHMTSRWDLTAILRWMTWSRHDRLSMRLVGPAPDRLGAAGLTDQVVLHRGFRDTFDVRLRAIVTLAGRLRLAFTLRSETSAVPATAVNPGAVDGLKLEPAIAARLRITSSFILAAGYAITFIPEVGTGRSTFDPTAVGACNDAGGDLASTACQARRAGTARPTASGRYSQTSHAFSLALTARF